MGTSRGGAESTEGKGIGREGPYNSASPREGVFE